jgi:hypothetical protein
MNMTVEDLRCALSHPGPPHQVITFALAQILGLDPLQIADGYRDFSLQDLTQRLRQESEERLQLSRVEATKAMVWQKLLTYDLATGSFRQFVYYWADIECKRYYAKKEREVRIVSAGALRPETDDNGGGDDFDMIDRLLGADSEDMEDSVFKHEVYDDLLRKVYDGSSPPHQSIAFGFTHLLEWTPQEVVTEHSKTLLQPLAKTLAKDFWDVSGLPAQRVQSRFQPLHRSLTQLFQEAVTEQNTLDTYPGLFGQIVGNTAFADYYTSPEKSQRAQNISEWCYSVKRRVGTRTIRERSGPLFEWLGEQKRRRMRGKS